MSPFRAFVFWLRDIAALAVQKLIFRRRRCYFNNLKVTAPDFWFLTNGDE